MSDRPHGISARVSNRLEIMSKRVSRRGLYEFYAAEYAGLAGGSRVLSVGAGGPINKQLVRFAVEKSFEVVTLDVSASRGPDVVADACRSPFAAESFDAVVMAEVLEHCHDPRGALAGARRALRPGGRLLLSTPFIFPIHNRPVDYWRFTRYGLELLLAGWEGVDVRERNSWPEAINVLGGRLYKEASANPLAAAVSGVRSFAAAPLARLLGAAVRTDAMTTGYVAVATKPAGKT